MNSGKATLIGSAALLAVSLISFTGCGSSAPSDKSSAGAPAPSKATSEATALAAKAKSAEAFPALPKAPADPEVIASIEGLKDCKMVRVSQGIWMSVASNPKVSSPDQERAKAYVMLHNGKITELGC